MDYTKKYLKYKSKYFNLKKQIGGQRKVEIYDKNNGNKLLYTLMLDDEDNIEVLKNIILDEIKSTRDVTNIERIDIFKMQGFCNPKLNGIDETMNKFCMSIIEKTPFTPVIMSTGFKFGKKEFTNTTSQHHYESYLIYNNIIGTFYGFVNKGYYLNGTKFIDLENGKGKYEASSIMLDGIFINNKLNGKGKKIRYFDDNTEMYTFTGIFVNNYLVQGTIIKTINKLGLSASETHEGTFEIKDDMEIIKKGKVTKSNGIIEEGTFDFRDGYIVIKEGTITRSDGTIIEQGTFINNKLNGQGKKITKVKNFLNGNTEIYTYNGNFVNNYLVQGKILRSKIKSGLIKSEIYEGTFETKEDIEFLKKGKVISDNGTILEGKFDFTNGDVFITEGKIKFPNGDIEEGYFIKDNLNGKGKRYIEKDKVWYEGNFINGVKNDE